MHELEGHKQEQIKRKQEVQKPLNWSMVITGETVFSEFVVVVSINFVSILANKTHPEVPLQAGQTRRVSVLIGTNS